jgi:signal transduction histidine kinase
LADKPIVILLVEDNSGDRRLISEMLAEASNVTFDVKYADRLQAAMEYLDQNRVEVILLDLGLPDSQGLETLKRVYAQVSELPIVVLTGLNDEMIGVQAVNEGAQDYLIKGQVDTHLLRRTIRYAIERKQAEERERRLQLQLDLSNRLASLGLMVEGIAHEINNPLTSAIGFAHLQEPLRMLSSYTQLLDKRYSDKLGNDADEFIAYAMDGNKRMRSLLHDLLEYSRVGTRGKPFSLVNCEHIVEQAIANLKIAIEECDASVSYDILPTIMGDEGQLVRLFQNLIGNAIKFRREEAPQVHISAKRMNYIVTFSVKDNGIGIDPQHSQSIFEIFRRLHTIEEYPGTGMGLAICKKIVERHGGHISVQSQPGQGSTFYFSVNTAGGEPA